MDDSTSSSLLPPNDGQNSAMTSPPIVPQPKTPPTIVKIFIGPDGLRSGWSFLLYVLMFLAIGAGFSFSQRLLRHGHRLPLMWGFLVGEIFALVAAIVSGLIMARIEKRPFGDYGYPRQGAFGKLFWLGMLWGIVALTVLMLSMRAVGAYYFGSLALHGMRMLKFGIFWAVFFVIVGLFEEFLLRGYTQFSLTRGIGFWPTAFLLSFAFGAIHLGNQGEDKVGALGAAIIGLFFCLTLRRTGNLWFAVGLHASWDWGETFLYSVANSGMEAPGHLFNPSFQGPRWLTGGSVGPEASIFVFIVMALMWLIFHFMYPPIKLAKPELAPTIGASPDSTRVPYQE
jgi:hypothetical protein